MSDGVQDFDELVALWNEELTAVERGELHAVASRASFRGMILQYADLGLGALIALGVLLAVIANPAPVTLAIGLVAVAGLLWTSWKRHLLQEEIDVLLRTRSRSDFLDAEIERLRIQRLRALVGLWAVPPAVLLFGMVAYAMQNGGSLAGFTANLIESATSLPVGPALVAAIVTLIVQQVRLVQRLGHEARALQGLRGEYRQEARLDTVALG